MTNTSKYDWDETNDYYFEGYLDGIEYLARTINDSKEFIERNSLHNINLLIQQIMRSHQGTRDYIKARRTPQTQN